MKTSPLLARTSLTLAGLLFSTVLLNGAAEAQVFNFSPAGFTGANVCANSASPAATCQILTNTSGNSGDSLPTVTSGGALRLTSASTNQHGSAWYYLNQPLTTGFTTAFQFSITNAGICSGCGFPGDGMALVIQGDPAGTGAIGYTGNGHNLSYGNEDLPSATGPGQAIANSLAVELDTYLNSEFGDPDGNHIAVQSCASTVSDPAPSSNSANHNYVCPNGKAANLALQSVPSGISLSDGQTHTLTVNYLPPGNCTTGCNNFSVYLDSVFVLHTTIDLAQQLILPNNSAYIGFTAATGAAVENSDIVSWSFSQLPLAPITITQPVQTGSTTFNYTPTLSATVDYSQSGLPSPAFDGVFMQGTVQGITDQQFSDLVTNTPFQGSSCIHQDLGQGTYACVTTTDLCTTSLNSTPTGINCPNTGTSALIGVTNVFTADPAQKPFLAPGYLMGKDTAVSCGAGADNTCKGLINIFTSITGDPTAKGRTKNFNSVLIPVQGVVQPSTTATTVPPLNNGWTNQAVTVNLASTDIVPANNSGALYPLPLVTGINYSVTGSNVPNPAFGAIVGPSGSFAIPGAAEGLTTVMFSATDTAGTSEAIVTTTSGQVATSLPMLIINVDKTAPVIAGPIISPASPVSGQAVTASYGCSDSASGVVLCGPPGSAPIPATLSTGTLTSAVDSSVGTHTFTVNATDQAGNAATPGSVTYTVSGSLLDINPTSIDFGNVKLSKRAVHPIKIKNIGNRTLVFSSITLTQTESDGNPGIEFTLSRGCSKLVAGATCKIVIGFLADKLVSAAGTVTFVDGAQGSPQQVQITGNVIK